MSEQQPFEANTNREKKRAQFVEPAKKSNKTPLIIIAVMALAAIAAYAMWPQAADKPLTGDVRIPAADLAGGKAKFFDYNLPNNRQIRFFALKSADGAYRAALDACDMCYHAKKGYRQEGDRMVCNNCGLEFPSNQINEVRGGCNPIGLPRQVEGDTVVIKAGDLEAGSRYF